MTNSPKRAKNSIEFFGVKTAHKDGRITWRFVDCAKAGKAQAETSAEFMADRFEQINPGASCEVIPMTAGEVAAVRA